MKRRSAFSAIEKFFLKHREKRYLYRKLLGDEYLFSLSTTRLMSSRGIIENCDIHANLPGSSAVAMEYVQSIPQRFEQITTNRDCVSLYLCTDSVNFFVNEVLEKIHRPFVLVTGDSDLAVNGSTIQNIETLLSNSNLKKWFAQNLNFQDPKIEPMPIGLDFHSAWQNPRHYSGRHILPAHQEGEIRGICRTARRFSERDPLVVCDWIGHSAYGDREEARRGIPEDARFVPTRRLPRHELWQEYVKYAFVASPSGVGMDCHRTWEAIAFGCVPIIKKSALTPLFEGMPVLVVERWDVLTAEYLKQQQQKLAAQSFDYSKIFLTYWRGRINNDMQGRTCMSTIDDMRSLV